MKLSTNPRNSTLNGLFAPNGGEKKTISAKFFNTGLRRKLYFAPKALFPIASARLPKLRSRGAYDKLVQSAGLQFQDNGYVSVSIRDIVSAVNLPKGTFYNYFASKEALASTIVEAQFKELYSSLPKYDDRANVQNLRRYFHSLASRPIRGRIHPTRLLSTLAAESLVLPPALKIQLAEGLGSWRDHLAAVLMQAPDQFELVVLTDADLLANFLVCSLLGAMICAKCDSSTVPLQAFAKIAIEQHLRVKKDA